MALSGGRLLAVADPGIPAAGGEVAAIAKLFPGRRRSSSTTWRAKATSKRGSRDSDVIHLSVHGKFDAAEPMLSYLSLARGAGDDGRLTAAEMFGLPLDKSRVVVLSACETGRAEATHGNEILGMVRALHLRGRRDARAVVLGSRFGGHGAVDADLLPGGAHRPDSGGGARGAEEVKSTPEYSHPYYWAAFAMVGR